MERRERDSDTGDYLYGEGIFDVLKNVASNLTNKTAKKLESKATEKLIEKGAEKIGEKQGNWWVRKFMISLVQRIK